MLTLLLALAATPLPPKDRVKESDLAAHIQVLASDEYEGRKPGTAASGKTLSYIANAFARAGLRPGAADGSWFQPVPLVDRSVGASRIEWTTQGKSLDVFGEVVLTSPAAREEIKGPVTYVGFGLAPPSDLRGQVVLFETDVPVGMTGAPNSGSRIGRLRDAGAVAVIGIAAATASRSAGESAPTWEQMRSVMGRVQTSRPGVLSMGPEVTGFMSAAAADKILGAAKRERAELRAAAAGSAFKPVPLGVNLSATVVAIVRDYTSYNVIGRLPGKRTNGEAVLITGHWDHLGICRPEGAPDRVCNGAVDNASGIAVMIEVAERLARGRRPVRDIVFVATTAEETGLLGANAYVAAPTVPLDKIAAVLNIDTIAIGPRGMPVSAVNRGNTAIDPLIDEAARRQGRALDTDLDANAFINRQDGAVFSRAGVPAVMAGGSFADIAKLQAFLGSVYHGPDDEFSDALPLGGAAEDAELHVLLARALADPKRYRRPTMVRP